MRWKVLLLSFFLCPVLFSKNTQVNPGTKKSITMKQKKHRVTLASTLEFDRPTPRTSDSLKDGTFEGLGTVGSVPGVLAK